MDIGASIKRLRKSHGETQQQLGEGELRDSIAADLLRRQLLQPVMAGSTVPQGMTETYTKMLLEQRKGVILPIPSAAMADPGKPTDKQLQEFHTAHKEDYTIPERRAFRFAELDRATVVSRVIPLAVDGIVRDGMAAAAAGLAAERADERVAAMVRDAVR